MPQTVLRGPNGQAAIDQATGTPLTMEEMLRRNGIVQMGNTTSMIGPGGTAGPNATAQPNAAVTPSSPAGPGGAVAAAMAQRSGGAGVSPTANPGTGTTDPTSDPAMEQLAATNTDPSTVDMLEKAGLVAAGTAAAYAAYRALKGRGTSGYEPDVNMFGEGPGDLSEMPRNSKVIDGEFTEVHPAKRIGSSTKQALSGRSAANQIEGRSGQKALPEPQKKLPNNGRTATAEAMQARAARGGPTDVGTIAGQAPVRTVSEPAESGLARTLGIPMEVIKMLKSNPGLSRTLSRVP